MYKILNFMIHSAKVRQNNVIFNIESENNKAAVLTAAIQPREREHKKYHSLSYSIVHACGDIKKYF